MTTKQHTTKPVADLLPGETFYFMEATYSVNIATGRRTPLNVRWGGRLVSMTPKKGRMDVTLYRLNNSNDLCATKPTTMSLEADRVVQVMADRHPGIREVAG